ncbi:asparaginase [Stomatohabitans albus]|uniref:asparaginase n=1 Tax=Stomatohabitans albus TaxID=3110766 RepID=UPI00300C346C
MTDLYLPTVAIATLGGTIVSAQTESGGIAPTVTPSDVVAQIPGLSRVARVVTVDQLSSTPSPSLTIAGVFEAIEWAKRQLDARTDGVVLALGTDTLEEVAFLADLVWAHQTPLVITGAMRAGDAAGSDGPANVLNAIATAVDPDIRGLGALAVINDEVHLASRVTKAHTVATNAFTSVNGGPIGRVIEQQLWIQNRPAQEHPAPLPRPGRTDHRVLVLEAGLAEDFAWLPALLDADTAIAGIVIAGAGAGHVSETAVETLTPLLDRIPIVIASRTNAGSTLRTTYGYPGGEIDLWARGFVFAGGLNARQARMLLWLLTGLDVDRDSIVSAFAQHDPTAPPTWMGLTQGVTPKMVADSDADSSPWKRRSDKSGKIAKARLSGWARGAQGSGSTA